MSVVRDSDGFRAGMAYAAHLLRVSVTPQTLAAVEPLRCCRAAVAVFAAGTADGLEDAAGKKVEAHDCPTGCAS